MRIAYSKVAPEALLAMGAVSKYVASASIPPQLRALVELRVSQINGCAYCVDKHTNEARQAGETQQRLDCMTVWHETSFFNDQERAALTWAEAVTTLGQEKVSDGFFEQIRKHFTEREVVDLTVIVAMMNAWNRLAISMRTAPAAR